MDLSRIAAYATLVVWFLLLVKMRPKCRSVPFLIPLVLGSFSLHWLAVIGASFLTPRDYGLLHAAITLALSILTALVFLSFAIRLGKRPLISLAFLIAVVSVIAGNGPLVWNHLYLVAHGIVLSVGTLSLLYALSNRTRLTTSSLTVLALLGSIQLIQASLWIVNALGSVSPSEVHKALPYVAAICWGGIGLAVSRRRSQATLRSRDISESYARVLMGARGAELYEGCRLVGAAILRSALSRILRGHILKGLGLLAAPIFILSKHLFLEPTSQDVSSLLSKLRT